jgi:predicted ATP-binding protein involved in virulence
MTNMTDTFVTKIKVKQSRNIHDLFIPLSEKERRHLIITGKNGSGKTSLLLDLFTFLTQVESGRHDAYEQHRNNLSVFQGHKASGYLQTYSKKQVEDTIRAEEEWFSHFGGTEIHFKNAKTLLKKVSAGNYLITFFDAKRLTESKVPTGFEKIGLKEKYNISDKANQDFIQYIVNLKVDRSFARDDGDAEEVKRIDIWFEKFEKWLRIILESSKLKLKFNRKTYNFQIIDGDKCPFGFNTLSDGYSAIINIVTELILRMETHVPQSYDLEGLVLIDEIETHLHVDLQKKILPFLADFFPKIQFIVTTHSPFVLSSLSNATICDLEKSLVTNDLSGYSYDALIESYFDSDKYSEEIKQKINQYEQLSAKKQLNEEEKDQLRFLRNYFAHAPKYLSKEVAVKLQEIVLNNLNKKNQKQT